MLLSLSTRLSRDPAYLSYPLSMFLCTLEIEPKGPCSVSTEYSPGIKNTTASCPPSPCGRLSRPPTTLRGLRPTSVLPRSPRIARFRKRADQMWFPCSRPQPIGWLGACSTPGGIRRETIRSKSTLRHALIRTSQAREFSPPGSRRVLPRHHTK